MPSLGARLLGGAAAGGGGRLPRLGARPPGAAPWRFWEGRAGAATLADPATARQAALDLACDAYGAVKATLKGRAVLCPPPQVLRGAFPAAAFAGAALWAGALVAEEEDGGGGRGGAAAAAAPVVPAPPRGPGRGGGRGGGRAAAACVDPPGVDLPPAAAAVIAGVLPASSLAADQAESLAELSALLQVAGFVVHWAEKGWGLGVQRPAGESV